MQQILQKKLQIHQKGVDKFQDTLDTIKKTGKAPEDYYSGGNFLNREGLLPTTDKNGNDITYIEYDVNPFTTKKEAQKDLLQDQMDLHGKLQSIIKALREQSRNDFF